MNGFHEDLEKQLGLIKERFGSQSELVDQLEASIELNKLWSSAFDHGTCTTKWVYDELTFPQPMPYDYVRMIITRGDGAEYSVPWRDIPDYFKRAEAKRRGITAETDRKSQTLNNRENKVLHTWLCKERMRERREARYGKK